jgi:hypothetical protein
LKTYNIVERKPQTVQSRASLHHSLPRYALHCSSYIFGPPGRSERQGEHSRTYLPYPCNKHRGDRLHTSTST